LVAEWLACAVVVVAGPDRVRRYPVTSGDGLTVGVRGVVGSALIGNGLGRPAHQWSLDVQVEAGSPGLVPGDLLAVHNLDVRHNAGCRHGWTIVGVVVTTTRPRPGHGVGLMPILCGPPGSVDLVVDAEAHRGVTAGTLTGA
jgi:hypothetical protein